MDRNMMSSRHESSAFVTSIPSGVATPSSTARLGCSSLSRSAARRVGVDRTSRRRCVVPVRRSVTASLAVETRPSSTSTASPAAVAIPTPPPPGKPKAAGVASASPITRLESPAELALLLQGGPDARTGGNRDITVVKIFASYCAACRGVTPKYRKLAAAYDAAAPSHDAASGLDDGAETKSNVKFCEMDFKHNEHFCQNALGVQSLPFFVVFRGDSLSAAESIGWRSVNQRLVDLIDDAIVTPSSNVSS